MKMEIRVGASGYQYNHWKERFYPKDLPKKDWFNHYAKVFDSVEINNSFYRWPREKTMKKWRETTPSGFKYTIKAPRTITHVKRLKAVEDAGVRLCINTDSHDIQHLDYMRFGVGTARRGWLETTDVVNTLPVKKFMEALK